MKTCSCPDLLFFPLCPEILSILLPSMFKHCLYPKTFYLIPSALLPIWVLPCTFVFLADEPMEVRDLPLLSSELCDFCSDHIDSAGGRTLPDPKASRENVRWLLKCFVKWKYKTESIYISMYLPSPVTLSRKSVLNVHWKDWCWSWNSNTLAAWWEELTHLKRPWCWERLRAGEGDDRGWDGWMTSPTWWTWVWVNSGSWWWTGRPGVLWFMGSKRVRHNWENELNWTEHLFIIFLASGVFYISAYFQFLFCMTFFKVHGSKCKLQKLCTLECPCYWLMPLVLMAWTQKCPCDWNGWSFFGMECFPSDTAHLDTWQDDHTKKIY